MKDYITQEKYDKLLNELNFLVKTKRSEIADELQQAGAMGDLRENSEYQQAREAQAELEQRIFQIEATIKNSEIISGGKKDEAGVGSIVSISKKGQAEKIEYKIVGAEEADMAERKISVHSPLGKAMVGKKKGESFQFEAPSGIMEYKIIEIK